MRLVQNVSYLYLFILQLTNCITSSWIRKGRLQVDGIFTSMNSQGVDTSVIIIFGILGGILVILLGGWFVYKKFFVKNEESISKTNTQAPVQISKDKDKQSSSSKNRVDLDPNYNISLEIQKEIERNKKEAYDFHKGIFHNNAKPVEPIKSANSNIEPHDITEMRDLVSNDAASRYVNNKQETKSTSNIESPQNKLAVSIQPQSQIEKMKSKMTLKQKSTIDTYAFMDQDSANDKRIKKFNNVFEDFKTRVSVIAEKVEEENDKDDFINTKQPKPKVQFVTKDLDVSSNHSKKKERSIIYSATMRSGPQDSFYRGVNSEEINNEFKIGIEGNENFGFELKQM